MPLGKPQQSVETSRQPRERVQTLLSTGDHGMIELTQWSKSHQIPLPYGLAVTVQPLSTSGMAAAQAAARRSVEAIERQARERSEAGAAGTSSRAEGPILPRLPRRRPDLRPRRARSRRAALPLPRARIDQPAGA